MVYVIYADQGGRTSSKNDVVIHPYVCGKSTGIKQELVASKFKGVQWGSMLGTLLFEG